MVFHLLFELGEARSVIVGLFPKELQATTSDWADAEDADVNQDELPGMTIVCSEVF